MSSEAKTLTADNAEELAAWCGGKAVVEHDALNHEQSSPGINVPVGDDVKRASMGDMIIRQNDGTFRIFKNG
jgi:hypothetical protein